MVDPEFIRRYENLSPELLETVRTVSNNETKQALALQWTVRVVAVGAFALAALIVWWAWAARDTLQSSLAIAIVAYFFAGSLLQSLWETLRQRLRRPSGGNET